MRTTTTSIEELPGEVLCLLGGRLAGKLTGSFDNFQVVIRYKYQKTPSKWTEHEHDINYFLRGYFSDFKDFTTPLDFFHIRDTALLKTIHSFFGVTKKTAIKKKPDIEYIPFKNIYDYAFSTTVEENSTEYLNTIKPAFLTPVETDTTITYNFDFEITRVYTKVQNG